MFISDWAKLNTIRYLNQSSFNEKGYIRTNRFEDLIDTWNVDTYKLYQYHHIDPNSLQDTMQNLWAHTDSEKDSLSEVVMASDRWSALSLRKLLADREWTWEVEKLSWRE